MQVVPKVEEKLPRSCYETNESDSESIGKSQEEKVIDHLPYKYKCYLQNTSKI